MRTITATTGATTLTFPTERVVRKPRVSGKELLVKAWDFIALREEEEDWEEEEDEGYPDLRGLSFIEMCKVSIPLVFKG